MLFFISRQASWPMRDDKIYPFISMKVYLVQLTSFDQKNVTSLTGGSNSPLRCLDFFAFLNFLVAMSINVLTLGIHHTGIILTHFRSCFDAVLAFAILPWCALVRKKWPILDQKWPNMAGLPMSWCGPNEMVQKGSKEALNGPQWSKGPKWSPMVKNIPKPFSETATLQKLAKVSKPRSFETELSHSSHVYTLYSWLNLCISCILCEILYQIDFIASFRVRTESC